MKMFRIKSHIFIFLFTFLFINNAFSKSNYFNEGKKFFENKKFSKSKFKFEQDIVFNPKSEFSYLYLAKIFNKENNDDLEEQNLNVVILLNPTNEEALYLLTLLRIKKRLGPQRTKIALESIKNEEWDLVCKSVLDYYDKCYEYEKVGKTSIKLLDLTDKKYDESILELINNVL